jgi:hypothetical protein
MPYPPPWERLSDALIRVVTATGQSNDQAQADICRAIAGGTVRFRAELKRHVPRGTTSSETLKECAFQIPRNLKPSDLDWEESRPKMAWLVRRGRYCVPGYWELARIEVSRADVTAVLCGAGEGQVATVTAPTRSATTSRTRPQLERAKLAIAECYPQGVPPQSELSNAMLCRRIGSWLKEHGMPGVSDDTILRAAGRRRR